MKIRTQKNGVMHFKAENKQDSLDLMKMLTGFSGNNSPERKALIERKEKEVEEEKNLKSSTDEIS